MERKCTKCGEASGEQSMCKPCGNQYRHEHYLKNKSIYQNKIKKYRLLLKQITLEAKKDVPCADCGQIYPDYVMDFDHLRDKKFNISCTRIISSVQKLKDEIAKCEIVCSNCHRIRTHNRKTCFS